MRRSDKRSTGFMVGSVAVLLAAGLWWNHLNAEPAINIPAQKLPRPNAYDYYVKAGKLHAALLAKTPGAGAVDPVTDTTSTTGLTPQKLAQLYPTAIKVQWIKTCAPALQTLRQGFAYEYLEPQQRSTTAIFPHLAQYRALARLLIIESHSRSEQGDWTGASRSTLDILRLGHDAPRGGSLISALVGYACNAIGRQELQKIMPHLNADAARAAATEMEKLQARRVPFADTLQTEKWYGHIYMQEIMRQKNWRITMWRSPMTNPFWPDMARLYLYSKNNITNNHVRYMDTLVAEAKKPYTMRKAPTLPKDPLNQMMLPVFERAHWNAARDETGNCLLMVQLALHAFQLEHKRLPDDLNELTPSYLKKVPADPYGGGEALRYRRTGKTYVLYSIGSDGKDDGGKPIVRAGVKAGSTNQYLIDSDSTGDYVAGINR